MESFFDRFESHARRSPSSLALCDGHTSWSYSELFERSYSIALDLHTRFKNGPEPIAVRGSKSLESMLALLGVVGSGRPFLFLDPNLPREEQDRILESIRPVAMIAERPRQWKKWQGDRAVKSQALIVDELSSERGTLPRVDPSSAYTIASTSGTTGTPLGVVRSHRSLLFNLDYFANLAEVESDSRLSVLASPAYGAFSTGFFGALTQGASAHLMTPAELITQVGFERLKSARLTHLHMVPTLFRSFLKCNFGSLPDLRVLKLGGEPLYRSDVELFRRSFSCTLINGLGVSEACGNVAHFVVKEDTEWEGDSVPVGFPIPGREIAVVDDGGRSVGPNEVGQIVVESLYLASGYWRNQELTEKVFQNLPSSKTRLATGDRGYFTADGALVHCGRNDGRIKRFGVRVELSQVEAALCRHPDVVAAGAVFRGGELVACYQSAHSVPEAELREFLRGHLPAAAVPNRFQKIEKLPLKGNGKIDRSALDIEDEMKYTQAPSPSALCLAQLIGRVLEQKVGPDDNFFQLGGCSVDAVRVAYLAEREGILLKPTDLLATPTARELADSRSQTSAPILLATGSGRPIFCFAGGPGGGFELFRLGPLARRLRGEVFGFGLPSDKLGLDFGQQLAEEVRKLQPEGPWLLLGECLGAFVAFEVARYLPGQSLLLFLDPPAPEVGWQTRLARIKKRLFSAAAWKRILWYLKRALAGAGLRSLVAPLETVLMPLRGSRWHESRHRRGVRQDKLPRDKTEKVRSSLLKRLPRPAPFFGVVWTTPGRMGGEAWRPLFGRGFELRSLEGRHSEYLTAHLDDTAEEIRAWI